MNMRIWPGRPYPLGATWDGAGVNFAIFSEHATKVELCLFDSHIAGGERLSFNPVFGSGGNAGQRDFANGRKKAAAVLRKTNAKDHGQIIADLTSFLIGRPCSFLGDFGAASWFSSANKAYNSGTKKAFRKGQVTPWAMTLACEVCFRQACMNSSPRNW